MNLVLLLFWGADWAVRATMKNSATFLKHPTCFHTFNKCEIRASVHFDQQKCVIPQKNPQKNRH